jgi:hypothetical protein
MPGLKRLAVVSCALGAVVCSIVARAQQPTGDGPRYRDGKTLIRPADYREWMFLSSGLGLSYEPPSAASAASPRFGNVFVNPSSYRSFMQTGKWPDGTIFVLENRSSSGEGSITKGGRFQTELTGIEAEVKDSRFPDGWAFFNFGQARSLKDAAEPLAGQSVAECVDCHTKNTAVERTFVQFYPTLLEVARQKGTLKPGF